MTLIRKHEVGKEVESRCGKCKQLRTHVIVAMEDETIKKVRCLICSSEHRYTPARPKPEAKSEPKPKTSRSKAGKEGGSDDRTICAATLTEWRNATETAPASRFKPYILNGVFQTGDLLQHASFGKGVVRTAEAGKMDVLFETGVRRLVYNRNI